MIKRTVSVLLCIVILMGFSACQKDNSNSILIDEVKSPVIIHTKTQQRYIDSKNPEDAKLYVTLSDDSLPQQLRLSWKFKGEEKPEEYIVKVSESEDFGEYFSYYTKRCFVKIYNLKLNTEYFWKVSTKLKSGETLESNVGKFKTEKGKVRFIYCDGITNMRDIGGYKTESGNEVRQGLIYRCARLNENKTKDAIITYNGLTVMSELGIKTELDLRGNPEAGMDYSLIENAEYKRVSIAGSYTASNYYTSNEQTLRDIFKLLGDKNNYPFIIHCSAGTDRTGFVCYTLEGLLGLSKDDMFKDYLFSNFQKGFSPTSRTLDFIINDYVSGYDSENGNTLSEKVERHLLNIGVLQSEIDTFKEMMLK